jgi:hypothetical protein
LFSKAFYQSYQFTFSNSAPSIRIEPLMKSTASIKLAFLSILLSFLVGGCDNEVKVNAPAKEILVIFGVLNPQQSVQYVRVTKAFLTESNAIQYAQETGVESPNATVVLSYFDEKEVLHQIRMEPIDTIRDSGGFRRPVRMYKTDSTILPGKTYTITATLAGEKPVVATAQTTVPDAPFIIRPSGTRFIGNQDNTDVVGNVSAYPLYRFDLATHMLTMQRETNGLTPGRAFEYRVYLDYQENGVPKTLTFGPTPFFEVSNMPCSGGSRNSLCYNIGKDFQRFLIANLNNQDSRYTYADSLMSRAVRVEITAVDTFVYNYIRINNPALVDFTTVKPEYTNVRNGYGLFGSVNTNMRYVRLPQCTKHLARLNNTPAPAQPCVP